MRQIEEIVHMIPLGHEIDRAIKPFDSSKANRVYLFVVRDRVKYSDEMIDKQEFFLDKVIHHLDERKIKYDIVDVDMFDILEVIRCISSKIVEEKTKNNLVYVNMSACGRLTSIAATLSAMTHKVPVYYVSADNYSLNEGDLQEHGISICKTEKISILNNFEITLPDYVGIQILIQLCEKDRSAKELRAFLRKNKVEGFTKDFENVSHDQQRVELIKELMILDKRYLTKLEDKSYVLRRKTGREIAVSITDSGRYVAYISGLMPNTT